VHIQCTHRIHICAKDRMNMLMKTARIKYYPVSNGDQTLLTLEDDTTILIDCNIRQDSQNGSDPEMFDVKEDLLKSVARRNGNPFVDVHILTHGDCDHCRGFKNNFYQGDPKKYSEENRNDDEIIIDEMWFSPMIAEKHQNDDEDIHQQEAERRLSLHRAEDSDRNLPGNRIRIVGYDGNKDYQDLNHLRITPGTVVNVFNGKEQDNFSFFVHAPFKEHLSSAEKDRNTTSIVLQARFTNSRGEFNCLAMFGGDSDHYSWSIILEKTKRYQNDVKERALDWDLFLAPHHCSWSFFNDRPQKDNPEPKASSLEVLDNKRRNAKVISSSKEVVNDNDNPPHYAAKQEYVKKVGSENFLNTETHLKKGKTPQPIVFEITHQGPMAPKEEEGSAKLAAGGSLGVIKRPSTYGRKPV
jgi:hypothetical protein